MKNDIQILFNKYLSDEINDIRFYGSNRLAYLTPFLENIISHDAPDGYAIINNTILLVEHFEFDSYTNLEILYYLHQNQHHLMVQMVMYG